MKKKLMILIIVLGLICVGTGAFLMYGKEKPTTPEQEENTSKDSKEMFKKIVNNFNKRDVAIFLNEQKSEIKAKLVDEETISIDYTFAGNENKFLLHLKDDVVTSESHLEENVALELVDSILEITDKNATFLAPFRTNTTSDYNLEQDGIEIEQKPKENLYKIKVKLGKKITLKELDDTIITTDNYKDENMKVTFNDETYNRKGYIIYKEETDSNGNKVVTFGQMDSVKENMRKSIANYIEAYHGKELSDDFLINNTLQKIQAESTFTKDNYKLEKDYLVFSSNDTDPYFDDYFKKNYQVVVLVIKK